VAQASLISICIPTYNRPDLLREAIDSCLAQTYQDFEIVISDDSKDNRSEAVVAEYQSKYPGRIGYVRNTPSLGQAANVNSLFERATGARLVLLHDDDLLLPNALEVLSNCWNLVPSLTAAFGKQYIMDMNGEVLLARSERENIFYGRRKEAAGSVLPALAGIQRMFPNDGYMVLTEVARRIGYRPFSEVGHACDFDFGFRCCLDANSIWFHDQYTTIYRLSGEAISKTSITEPNVFEILSEYKQAHKGECPAEVQVAIDKVLTYFAPGAVSGYARQGQGRKALRILVSSDYSIGEKLSLRFLFHTALTFSALVGGSSWAEGVIAIWKWFGAFRRPREISS
jgi:glycosyltransferase involved in cell wall biosynthesis